MPIGVIARLRVHPGKGPEFEAAFARQAQAVRDNEPGNKLYRLCRSREDPNGYIVMELYNRDEDLVAHRESAHMAANRPVMAGLVAERLGVEVYDAI